MKTKLLTIAVFLACVINGMLLIDAFAIGKPPADVVTTTVLPLSQPQPQQNEEITVAGEVVVLSYWNYKNWRPVRNMVKYFHNRKLRNYYYCGL